MTTFRIAATLVLLGAACPARAEIVVVFDRSVPTRLSPEAALTLTVNEMYTLFGGVPSVTVNTEGSYLYRAPGWNAALSDDERDALRARIEQAWAPARVTWMQTRPDDDARRETQVEEQRLRQTEAATAFQQSLRGSDRTPSDYNAFFDGNTRLRDAVGAPVPGAIVPGGLSGASRVSTALAVPTLPVNDPPALTDPEPEYPYQSVIESEAAAAGVDPEIVRAVVEAKSRFNAGKSGGGAFGLMMVSRGTADWVGVTGDLHDPVNNVRAGARILKRLLDRFDGDLSRALAAYQVGSRAVIQSGGIPNRAEVKDFLASFQLAYRGVTDEPVAAVPVPEHPNLRRAVEEVRERVSPAPQPDNHPMRRYRRIIESAANHYGIEPDLLDAMCRIENPWGDPHRVSAAGAVGLCQLMPETAAWMGVKDSTDPGQNIWGAARYVKWLLTQDYINHDPVLMVAGYNAGPRYIQRLGRIPRIRETMRHVRRVFDMYEDLSGVSVDYQRHMPS